MSDHDAKTKADGAESASTVGLERNGFTYCWLVELFQRGGNSMGRYHTGFTDVGQQSRSTASAHEAKRYAQADAERTADALNVHMMSCEWKAVEHGFAL